MYIKDSDNDGKDELIINKSELFELDERNNHYSMGHIITPQDIIKAHGWAQMETFIPIKLRTKHDR